MPNLQTPLSKILRTTKNHLNKLEELGIKTIQDLLLFFPRNYEDQRTYTTVSELRTDEVSNVKGTISKLVHRRSRQGKPLTFGLFSDDTGSIKTVWYNQSYIQRILKNDMPIILSGKAKFSRGSMSFFNPAYELLKTEQVHTGRIIPVYHQSEVVTSKWLREKLKPLIQEWIQHLPDHLPPEIRQDYQLIDYAKAVYEAHFPSDDKALEQAKYRLSFDELFLLQLKALQKKWFWQNVEKHQQKPISHYGKADQLIADLPFELTKAQQCSLQEIQQDLEKPYPMSRLLQGDVGSGKTVVAGVAIFNTITAGYQAALMAPTEILARQHYSTLFKLLNPYGLNIQFISGSTKKSEKNNIYNQLQNGTVDLVVGTHALIQEGVSWNNLGLAIIDEQHRFGVKQREILKQNGHPHLLSLSATPIPRTLAMTIYGDQDLSIIDELPKGRQTIITRVVPEKKRLDAYRWIEAQVSKGRQAFVICPLIDESDTLEVKSAIQEHQHLSQNIFPDLKVGLLHGKMLPQEKDAIMQDFKENKLNILVSTSVIEVGIDVPNATIMLIEGADRFGLSQLHQFRGRVGRGKNQSYCFLFPKNQSQDSRSRLKAMVDYSSGFKLAEIDLELRGPGHIYGLKQSGIPDLKMATLTDAQTIATARQAAQALINKDPYLKNYPKLTTKLSEHNDVYVQD